MGGGGGGHVHCVTKEKDKEKEKQKQKEKEKEKREEDEEGRNGRLGYRKCSPTVVREVIDDNTVEWLNGLACKGYRLPTEAEWEYAARAGSETLFWSGDTLEDLARAGWFQGNGAVDGQIQTHPVAQKAANSWGLFDVHGNVWEWVHDGYGPYPDAAQVDPLGPRASNQRVIRGGDVFDDLTGTRSAARAGFPHGGSRGGIGFRLIFP